jgi:enamine deaminase RidA (YjgF/YER057c/UK114 family)
VSSGSPWEPKFGFSRAVRVGPQVFVSGTTSVRPDGSVSGAGDLYAQSRETLRVIGQALAQLGASWEDVVRTRTFVTDIGRWEEVARAHGEIFGTIRPAATLVEVPRLIHPDMLVEIEVDAVAG